MDEFRPEMLTNPCSTSFPYIFFIKKISLYNNALSPQKQPKWGYIIILKYGNSSAYPHKKRSHIRYRHLCLFCILYVIIYKFIWIILIFYCRKLSDKHSPRKAYTYTGYRSRYAQHRYVQHDIPAFHEKCRHDYLTCVVAHSAEYTCSK